MATISRKLPSVLAPLFASTLAAHGSLRCPFASRDHSLRSGSRNSLRLLAVAAL